MRRYSPDYPGFEGKDLTPGDVIELNPLFAPETVRQFRKLVQDHFYDGLSFYRVIDGFVAQGGDGSDLGELSLVPPIKAEFETELPEDIEFMPAQKNDLFAPEKSVPGVFAVGIIKVHDLDNGRIALMPGDEILIVKVPVPLVHGDRRLLQDP